MDYFRVKTRYPFDLLLKRSASPILDSIVTSCDGFH
jgi:hypothetical protein